MRVTDVPLATGGRAYLVERGLEEEGPDANASLQALIADYLDQARRLQRCPLERDALLTDTRASTQLAPEATKDSPFAVMVKYGVDTWPEAIAARAAARCGQRVETECDSRGLHFRRGVAGSRPGGRLW